MLKSFSSVLVLSIAIVSVALIVRDAPRVDAAGAGAANDKRIYLERSFARDEERTFGTIPAGKKLLLMDFYAKQGAGAFEVYADGERVGPGFTAGALGSVLPPMINFTAGLEIKGGQEFSIRHFAEVSSPSVQLFVGGLLVDE